MKLMEMIATLPLELRTSITWHRGSEMAQHARFDTETEEPASGQMESVLSTPTLGQVLVAVEEGVEVNVLGLTVGIDPLDFAIKLPGLGRLGPGPGPEVDAELIERGRETNSGS